MNGTLEYPRFRWVVFLVICLASLSMQAGMLAYSPLLGVIAQDLKIHPGDAANFLAVFLITASISILLGGYLNMRLGMWVTVAIGLLLSAVPPVLLPWLGHSYSSVLFLRFIQGLTIGLILTSWSVMASRWFPPHERGRAASIPGATQSFGGIVGVLGAPALLQATGAWQSAMAIISVLAWAALVILLVTALAGRKYEPAAGQVAGHEGGGGGSVKEAMSQPLAWLGIFITFLTAWMFQAFTDLTPAYLAIDRPVGVGYGPMMAGQLMIVVFIAGTIGPFLTGFLIDKTFRGSYIPTLVIGFILSAVFSFLLVFPAVYENIPVLVICLALAGMSTQLLYPSIVCAIVASYPPGIVSVMQGLWMGLGAFGGAAGVFTNGRILAHTGTYVLALQLFLLIGAVGLVLVYFLKRHARRTLTDSARQQAAGIS